LRLLQIFFVPGSGGKNNIVISLIDVLGEWPTFLISLVMIWFWCVVVAIKPTPTHSPTHPPPYLPTS
jgi:hypothetical protein